MGKARVYSVTFAGAERMVEANNQAQAEHHIARVETARVKDQITDVHAASSIAVSAFVRGGGKIETAGVIPEAPKNPADRARDLLGGGTPPTFPLPEEERDGRHEQHCPGHVGSEQDPKVCEHCGVHIDELRPDDNSEEESQ